MSFPQPFYLPIDARVLFLQFHNIETGRVSVLFIFYS